MYSGFSCVCTGIPSVIQPEFSRYDANRGIDTIRHIWNTGILLTEQYVSYKMETDVIQTSLNPYISGNVTLSNMETER